MDRWLVAFVCGMACAPGLEGCHDDEASTSAAPASTAPASCAVGDAGTSSGDVRPALLFGSTYETSPWPRDGFHLDHLPFKGKEGALSDLVAAIEELDGAPVRTSIFFPTDGAAHPTGKVDGRAILVDLTDAKRVPGDLDLFHRESTRELVALVSSSLVFRPGHRYACLIESNEVRRSAAMDDALRSCGPDPSPLGSMADAATLAGVSLDAVSGATVFTVGHPTRALHAIRTQLDGVDAPVARIDRVLADPGSLDDFLGTPATTRSGIGDPAGLVHDAIGAVVLGSFDAPSFVSDDPAHLGRMEIDAEGKARIKGTAKVPFLLTIPAGADLAKTPVLIFQHGLNASRMQVAAVANDYARAGYATIGIDALFHGERMPMAKDVKHNFTGAAGPDGIADEDALGASVIFFDFGGDPSTGVNPLDGRVVQDNLRQAALDISSLVRLLKKGDMTAVAASHSSLASLTLDASTLVYTGESFGSITGAVATAIEPELAAAVLAVPGAGIFVPTFGDSPTFGQLVGTMLQTTFDVDLDLSDPVALPAEAQRSLALFQAAIQAGDPVSYAEEIGESGKSLLMLMAFSDETIPNQSGELLASAAGATAVRVPGRTQSLRYVTLPEVSPPFAGSPVVAVVNADPATHIMYTRFHDVRKYGVGFPPAKKLGTPQQIDEPIEWLHALATSFADSVRAGAPAIAPAP
jgi:hypothetical protein